MRTIEFKRRWGFHLDAVQWATGYCAIAPFLHDELPWWMALIAIPLCVQMPSLNITWDAAKKER